MATDDVLVDVPLFVGMGEASDEQNRDRAAVVSENSRFLKEGSVSTMPPLVQAWEDTQYIDVRVLPTVDDVYVSDSRSLSRLESNGTTTQITGLRRPLDPQELEIALGRPCIAWPQAVVCGSEIVATWLEVDARYGYVPYIATLNLEGEILGAPAPLVAAGSTASGTVSPKYSLTRVDDDTVIVACVSGADSVVSPPIEFFQVAYIRVGRVFVTSGGVYVSNTGGAQAAYVASCYDGTNMRHITYSAPAANTDPWTSGVTQLWEVDVNGNLVSTTIPSFSASSFANLAHNPVTDKVWCVYRGYDAPEAFLSEVSGAPTAPVALNNSHPWLKTSFASSGAGTTPTPHVRAVFWQFSRLEDGFIYFDSAGNGNVVCQGQGNTGISYDAQNFLGFSVWRLGTSIGSGSTPATFPGLSFVGGAWVADTDLFIPAVERAPWYSEVTGSNDDPASEFMYVPSAAEMGWYGHYNDSGLGGSSGQPGTRPISPPSYSIGCVAMVGVSGNREVSAYHSMDEATDHTGLYQSPNLNGLSTGNPAAPANYRCTMGSVLLVGGTPHLLSAKQVEARLVGGNGRGGYSAENLRLEGWGCALSLMSLGNSKYPQTSSTAHRPVIGHDLISTLSGGDILPTALPTPPTMSSPDFTGTGDAVMKRSYKLLWCYVDEDGIRHRGPPSQEYRIRDEDVEAGVDEGTFRVQVPASQLAVPSGRYLLEVYANPITDGVVGGTLVLVDSISLGDTASGTSVSTSSLLVPYSYADSVEGLPLLYTDGGVLPNEARPTTGLITFNRQRVWSFDDRQLFFSKESRYKQPFSFNSNLYFDSPDGSAFTGVASLDEQTVAFTRTGVYLNRGGLPNDLGAGGNTTLHKLTSPSGCRNSASVVEADLGIFFQGERGIYLLGRDLSVSYVGFAVETTLGDKDVNWGFYDKSNNEVVFSAFGVLYVYNTLLQQWGTRVLDVNTNHGAWHPSYGAIFTRNTQVLTENSSPDNLTAYFPLRHSSPWMSLGSKQGQQRLKSKQGQQRLKEVLIQGFVTVGPRHVPAVFVGEVEVSPEEILARDPYGLLTVKLYIDHQEEPVLSKVVDLDTVDNDLLELRVLNPRQRCRAFRVEICTEAANIDLTLTSIVALVGSKKGVDKRQITVGQ